MVSRHRGSCAHQPSGAKIQKHKLAIATAKTKILHQPLARKPATNPTIPATTKLGVTKALPFPKKSPGVKYPQRTQATVNNTNALKSEPDERTPMSRVLMTANDPSSATRHTGRNACNRDAPAGFAAAHGYVSSSPSYLGMNSRSNSTSGLFK
jgi:hypothetical protein